MELTKEEKEMLEGKQGNAVKKAMQILTALGDIYGAKRLINVASVQIAGVSYHNLGEAGLDFLAEMAKDGNVKVLTTLNPAGMDMENWKALGFEPEFAKQQGRVIDAFKKMGVITTCTCTPYFIGNNPRFGEHVAWSESSAVCYANSVMGLKTNREGGPSALAAALTGKTPEYKLHLEENRQAEIIVNVKAKMEDVTDFGALGYVIGKKIGNKIALINGIKEANVDQLKSFSASIATYGGTAMFHMEGITPNQTKEPIKKIVILEPDIKEAKNFLEDETDVDFVSIGCPHASLNEVREIAMLLDGKKVNKETWIHTARPIKQIADRMGYTEMIEKSGAKFACDTCMAVAPLKGRFHGLATNSAKASYYGRGSNNFKVLFRPLKECLRIAME